jgi:hypothetical protein
VRLAGTKTEEPVPKTVLTVTVEVEVEAEAKVLLIAGPSPERIEDAMSLGRFRRSG